MYTLPSTYTTSISERVQNNINLAERFDFLLLNSMYGNGTEIYIYHGCGYFKELETFVIRLPCDTCTKIRNWVLILERPRGTFVFNFTECMMINAVLSVRIIYYQAVAMRENNNDEIFCLHYCIRDLYFSAPLVRSTSNRCAWPVQIPTIAHARQTMPVCFRDPSETRRPTRSPRSFYYYFIICFVYYFLEICICHSTKNYPSTTAV